MNLPKVNVEVKPSPIAGVGLFAAAAFKPGDQVIVWPDGADEEILPLADFAKAAEKFKEMVIAFCVGSPEGYYGPEKMDFNHLPISWFLNHSCDGNLGFDEAGNFVAIKNIAAGEELNYDYALVESSPTFLLNCCCGSANCRKKITGFDWQNKLVPADCMSPHLKARLNQSS